MNEYQNHPSLTPQQQADFNQAEGYAHIANEVFEPRRDAAIAGDKTSFESADRDLETYQKMATVLMPPRAAFETNQQIAVPEPEAATETVTGLEASSVWDELTPERQKAARSYSEAMARMPLFESKDIQPEDFRVVKTGEAYKPRYSVIYAKTDRLDLGDLAKPYDPKRSWNSIKPGKPNQAFITEVDGQPVDVRKAQVYETLAAVSKENPQIREWVWRTGEPEKADRSGAPAVYLIDGQANGHVIHRGDGNDDLGFRPAVDLK